MASTFSMSKPITAKTGDFIPTMPQLNCPGNGAYYFDRKKKKYITGVLKQFYS